MVRALTSGKPKPRSPVLDVPLSSR